MESIHAQRAYRRDLPKQSPWNAYSGTHALAPDKLRRRKAPLQTGVLRGALADNDYIMVPARRKRQITAPPFSWRIVLMHADNPETGVLACEVQDDVIFGRQGGQGHLPDIDLSPFGGFDFGVSRQHILLRPTARRLFIIDLQSMNGTHVNGVPLDAGMALPLHHNDTLSLGKLHLIVKIMSDPSGQR